MQQGCLHGINGVLRRHIARVGAAYGDRIVSAQRVLADDDYLRNLLLSGRITEQCLQNALKGHNLFPGNFGWLEDYDDLVLERADIAFSAKFGRDPVRHVDFRSNGDYHTICRNLTRDWNYYDTEAGEVPCDSLEEVVRPAAVGAAAPPSVKLVKISDVTIWVVLVVIVLGLLAFYGANKTGNLALMVVSAVGLFVASVASVCVFPPYRCPRCHAKYATPITAICKSCGVRFQSGREMAEAMFRSHCSVGAEGDSTAFQ